MRILAPEQPLAESVEVLGDAIRVVLRDGRRLDVPLTWFPRLATATPDQLMNYRDCSVKGSASIGPISTKTFRSGGSCTPQRTTSDRLVERVLVALLGALRARPDAVPAFAVAVRGHFGGAADSVTRIVCMDSGACIDLDFHVEEGG